MQGFFFLWIMGDMIRDKKYKTTSKMYCYYFEDDGENYNL